MTSSHKWLLGIYVNHGLQCHAVASTDTSVVSSGNNSNYLIGHNSLNLLFPIWSIGYLHSATPMICTSTGKLLTLNRCNTKNHLGSGWKALNCWLTFNWKCCIIFYIFAFCTTIWTIFVPLFVIVNKSTDKVASFKSLPEVSSIHERKKLFSGLSFNWCCEQTHRTFQRKTTRAGEIPLLATDGLNMWPGQSKFMVQ